MNKKGTKFITARKTIPNVNLRGTYVYLDLASVHMLAVPWSTKQLYNHIVYISALASNFEAGGFQKLQLSTGLEPSDVRNAQAEFRKFDMENNGKME